MQQKRFNLVLKYSININYNNYPLQHTYIKIHSVYKVRSQDFDWYNKLK